MAAGPPIKTFIKDPDATEIYTLNWSGGAPGPWLSSGDAINTSTWSVSSTGITSSTGALTSTTTSITVSGGTSGEDYDFTNRISTVGGRVTDRTIRIKVLER